MMENLLLIVVSAASPSYFVPPSSCPRSGEVGSDRYKERL